MSDDLVVEVSDHVLRITVNRPASMNALTAQTLVDLVGVFAEHADNPAVRAVVLTGAGRAFCTGADLQAMSDGLGGPIDPTGLDAANELVAAIRAFTRPVIAAVNGPAAGVGLSLALAADLTVATESSYLLLAFARVGLMPDGGATALVAASIGRARALRMALLAEPLPAVDAEAAGLIGLVFPDDEFAAGVELLARQIASGPSGAFAATKNAINDATLVELDAAFARERAGQLALLASADFAEGAAAFLAKRPAVFGG